LQLKQVPGNLDELLADKNINPLGNMTFLKELQNRLKQQFDLERPYHQLDDWVSMHTFSFESCVIRELGITSPGGNHEKSIDNILSESNEKNRFFRYAVFEPVNRAEQRKAIILLHGLNERSWEKYLSWAYVLALNTGVPVILFPLANHINRSPSAWSFPRQMNKVVGSREKSYGKIGNSSFANAALSQRIDLSPGVFISSGIQSIADIVELTRHIKSGYHPLFKTGASVDFFAYSIGAFVTEILLLSNPFDLFSSSKAFFFCGGSTFDQMDGRSRSILDNRAFETLRRFISERETSTDRWKFPDCLIPFSNRVWEVFTSLISIDQFRKMQNNTLEMIKKIKAVGLKVDHVIPGDAICKTLCIGGNQNVRVTDFDFKYSHEAPFPLSDSSVQEKVDSAFKSLFREASEFLSPGSSKRPEAL
jgi:hypothetical protein